MSGGKGFPGDDRQQSQFRYRSLSIRTGHVWRNRAGLPELDAVSPDQAKSRNTDE